MRAVNNACIFLLCHAEMCMLFWVQYLFLLMQLRMGVGRDIQDNREEGHRETWGLGGSKGKAERQRVGG